MKVLNYYFIGQPTAKRSEEPHKCGTPNNLKIIFYRIWLMPYQPDAVRAGFDLNPV